MSGGARHRRKGDRCERELVERHKALGVHAERYPLSGASRFRGSGHAPERERPRAVGNTVEAMGSDTKSDYPTTARSASGGAS